MMQKIHIFHSNFGEIILSLDLHWFCLYPVTIFPVRSFCRHLTDVDFRIEVGCKRIPMISTVTIQNVNIVDLIKIVFQRICRKYSCYSGIKSTSQQRCNSCFFKFLTVCPLPFIFEFCSIFRLIICSVYIIHSCRKAGIHNCKILIWKCQIQYHIWFFLLDQRDQFFCVICIHLCSCNRSVVGSLQFFFQCFTFRNRTAGNTDCIKYFTVLTTFMYSYTCNSSTSNNQYFSHFLSPSFLFFLLLNLQCK